MSDLDLGIYIEPVALVVGGSSPTDPKSTIDRDVR